MNNIKGISFVNDGNAKKISITYEIVNDEGKVVKHNAKITRVVTDADASSNIDALQTFAQDIVDSL